MLKKTHTIRKQKDIKDVFKLGKTFYSRELLLKIKDNKLNKYRMTVVVSSKVSQKAVVRNKIKRQIKAIFIKEIKNKKNINKDFIFITLPQIKNLTKEEVGVKALQLMRSI